ncbi:hypothetical protein AXG89_32990 (plasmid) [Burkholderia sp. PAMC 26561]|nr:hypothetical protein AXG89_32990 [Burkholderia sp. PAMC 26561]
MAGNPIDALRRVFFVYGEITMQLGQAVFGQKDLAARAVAASADAIAVVPSAKIDTDGKTVNQVYGALWACLSRTELEPEWLSLANTRDHPDEYAYGARHARMWPSQFMFDRLSVSVCIGNSEGWIIHVDWVTRPEAEDLERRYAMMPLLRAKVFNRNQAWDLARLIAHKLDVA